MYICFILCYYSLRELLASRHKAKQQYSKMRSDTLIKLQLLDNKRGSYKCCTCMGVFFLKTVQDLVFHLERMMTAFHVFTKHCHRSLQQGAVFPIQPELIGLGEHLGESEQPLIKLNEDLINPTSDD